MNYGFETPDGWKAIDEWLDGPFFEKLESDGEVLLSLAARKHIAQKIFHFTQLSIYYSAPRTAGARTGTEQNRRARKGVD